MPFDATVVAQATLEAMRGPIAAYQNRAAAAADGVRALLDADTDTPAREREAATLGEFAAGRVDFERFGAILQATDALDPHERAIVARARDLLSEIAALPASRFLVDNPSGGHLAGVLANTFAGFGRFYAALVLVELIRARRFERDDLEMIHGLARYRWTRAERAASPPLIVTVDGADLWAGEIAQYLDGNQKVVLVVRPPAPPAALVRLITPGTLVLQTSRVEGLLPIFETSAPAVAAVLPEGAAEFIHRPGAAHVHERLSVSFTPGAHRAAIEGWSAWQQQQELEQLIMLATAPASRAAVVAGNGIAADPADRLAAWLLSHADAAVSLPTQTSGAP